MANINKVIELQQEFLKRLSQHNPSPTHIVPKLLERIMECDDELLEFTLGKVGQKLQQFARNVDFQHPEIVTIFDGAMADDQAFAQECIELLLLGKYAKENQLTRLVPHLGRILTKETLARNVIKKIDIPQNNRMHVRLLNDSKEREVVRLTKRMQVIDLQSVYKKGEEAWKVQPDSFTKFLRFDTAYQDDLKMAEKKAKRYDELGCISLASEVRKSIEAFREHMEHSYYGFNRITMTNAAVILAKSLEYTFVPSILGDSKITVERKYFEKYNFDPEQTLQFNPHISQVAGWPIFNNRQLPPFEYEPRVYPLHDLTDILPEEVQRTIDLLEKFPDAGNKPIFDHFGVIVPGVKFPSVDASNKYTILDEQGLAISYKSRMEAIKHLDKILVKGKYFVPIMVGEKDGKCYFISYFD